MKAVAPKMLTSISIENFQAHAARTIAISPEITTIIGESDGGKSAILRALRWAAFNRPGGEAFIRHGEKQCRVTLEIDGRAITRTKGALNEYRLDDKVFKAFGAGVPPEIAAVLNMADVNFQGQHDAPFWFSLSAGEAARSLNQIIDLGAIDSVLGWLSAEGRTAATRVALCEERLEAAKAARAALRPAKEMAAALGRVEALEAAWATAAGKALLAGRALTAARNAQSIRDKAAKAALAAGSLAVMGAGVAQITAKRVALAAILQKAALARAAGRKRIPPLAPLEGLAHTAALAAGTAKSLGAGILAAKAAARQFALAKGAAGATAGEFAAALADNAICPLCGK